MAKSFAFPSYATAALRHCICSVPAPVLSNNSQCQCPSSAMKLTLIYGEEGACVEPRNTRHLSEGDIALFQAIASKYLSARIEPRITYSEGTLHQWSTCDLERLMNRTLVDCANVEVAEKAALAELHSMLNFAKIGRVDKDKAFIRTVRDLSGTAITAHLLFEAMTEELRITRIILLTRRDLQN